MSHFKRILFVGLVILAPTVLLVAKPPPEGKGSTPAVMLQLGKGDRLLIRQGSGMSSVAFSPDGKWLASAGEEHLIRLWDLQTNTEVRRFEGHRAFIRTVEFSPDGKLLASAGDDEGAFLWDTATGKELRRIGKHTNGFRLAAFSPDGRTLVSSGFDERIGLWDAATGKQLHLFRAHPRVPYSVAFSPDGKTLASGGDKEGTIRLWDAATGKPLRSWDGKDQCIYSVAFSPDGRLLASGGASAARLWEVATGQEVQCLEGHDGGVSKVAFAPDGRTLVTASYFHTIHLWETATGAEIRRLGKHADFVWGLAYSPTARALASAGSDGTVVVWELGPTPGKQKGTAELPAGELERAWRDLAGADAAQGFAAALALAAAPPRQVVPLLQECLPSATEPPPSAERLERLIHDLDDEAFVVRERAAHELARLGDLAGGAIRKALAGAPSAEARRRLESLVEKLDARVLPADRLRVLRTLRVLEELDTPETRQLLKRFAGAQPDDILTNEAAAALGRLARRSETSK
jgi:WD40 repeat protein